MVTSTTKRAKALKSGGFPKAAHTDHTVHNVEVNKPPALNFQASFQSLNLDSEQIITDDQKLLKSLFLKNKDQNTHSEEKQYKIRAIQKNQIILRQKSQTLLLAIEI